MSDHHGRGPVVQQELLSQHLVALRHERGLTQERVSRDLSWSEAKVRRFEGGNQTLPLRMLDALLELYRVANKPLGQELRQLGEGARKRAWWSRYRSLMTPSYRRFVGLEAGADRILQIQTAVIPGLLQTKEYAQWITGECEAPELVEPLLEIRMHRQAATSVRTPPPRQVYLLDETVIRKRMGPPGLMSRQLHHLLAAAEEPQVDIRVIPDGHGMHFGLRSGPFILIEFDNRLDSVLCKEQMNSCTLSSKKDETIPYKAKFTQTMTEEALDSSDSMAMIRKYATSLE